MSWTKYFSKIVVINLKKREDRLIEIYEEMDRMNIPFELVTAIENENGAIGLKDTVVGILERGIAEGWENVLIFEDDALFIESKQVVDDTMMNAINQLPDTWMLFYLSGQASNGFKYRVGSNLLQLDNCYATHSWALSRHAMVHILAHGLDAPIDNSVVNKIQTLQRSFITYPILTTQRFGFSNIGNSEIDWSPFLVTRYYQKLAEL